MAALHIFLQGKCLDLGMQGSVHGLVDENGHETFTGKQASSK